MIIRFFLLSSTLITICNTLNCYSCGVFLSAPTEECKGKPTETICDPDHLGCLTITGKNSDNTFYVEKRCADKKDDLQSGCINIGVRGIKAKQCMCDTDLCNSSERQSLFLISLSVIFSLFVFIF